MTGPGRERLAGAVALVTGSSSGIGRAVARAFAEEGARTVVTARRREALESLGRAGAVVEAVDLVDDAAVHGLAERTLARFGRLDVLVHAAARIALGPVATAPVDDFDDQYRLNVRAPYVLTQALLPGLVEARGHVVFVNSLAGHRASAGSAQYAATKHALRALADALRAELRPHRVRVTSVYPGRTATPMQAWIHEQEGREYRADALLQPEDVAEIVVAAATASPAAEVADVVVRPALSP